jgi:hypothetical protein
LVVDELLDLLVRKNGFYAFESALHVFPMRSIRSEIGLVEWNSHSLWSGEYQEKLIDHCLFFAEDIFGGQFCVRPEGVFLFDPETGVFDFLAKDLEGWAQAVLSDYEVLTGYPLAHRWQKLNGAIPPGMRLIPKTPFVLGGEFSTENLMIFDRIKGMQLRANLAVQIRDLPDGTPIKWDVTD